MADIRLKTITVDNPSIPLTIQNGRVLITDTTGSGSAMSGALVINGGLGIKNSTDSVSSTSGGALTVAGGVSILRGVAIGGDLAVEKSTGELTIAGLVKPRLHVSSVAADQPLFSLAPNGINTRLEITDDVFTINITRPSTNATTGALCIAGGLSISTTADGALTVGGGASVGGTVVVGGGIVSLVPNTLGNLFTTTYGNVGIGTTAPNTALTITPYTSGSKINLYGTSGTLFTGLGVSESGDLTYHVLSTSASHVFYGAGGGPGTELFRIDGRGYVGIGTSTPQSTLDVNGSINFVTTLNSNGNVLNNNFATGTRFSVNTNAVLRQLRTSRANATDCVSDWYTRYTSGGKNLLGVAWSIDTGIFAAVGGNALILSRDGLNWTENQSFIDESFNAKEIIWSSGLGRFVVVGVGTDARIATSIDGSDWVVYNNLSGTLNAVAYSPELEMTVAVGEDGLVAYSADGNTWTPASEPVGSEEVNWRSIVWNTDRGEFVIVSSDGYVAYSEDGIEWNVSFVGLSFLSVCWSSELGLYVAGLTGGTIAYASAGAQDWTTVAVSDVGDVTAVTWSEQLSIFVAADTSGKIMYSHDGKYWTLTFTPDAAGAVNALLWSPEFSMFLAAGDGQISTSRLGIPARYSSVLANPSQMTVEYSSGNVGIGTTAPNYRLHVVGDISATGLTASNVQVGGDIVSGSIRTGDISGGALHLSGALTAGNMGATMLSAGNVHLSGGLVTDTVKATSISTGNVWVSGGVTCETLVGGSLSASGPVQRVGILYVQDDKIGIRTSAPTAELDVRGSFFVNGTITNFGTEPSTNSTTGSIVVYGGLSIASSQEATSATSGGGLTVAGGVGIGGKLFVDGTAHVNDSLIVGGGVSINGTQESTGATLASALQVAGGVSVGEDLYVGGTFHNDYPIYANRLVISGTEPAINFSTGSLIVNGGVSISNSQNATGLLDGGALLVSGGASFGGDFYVGGRTYIYGGSKYDDNDGDAITISKVSGGGGGGGGVRQYTLGVKEGDFLLGRYNNAGTFVENVYRVDGNDGSITFNNTSATTSFSVAGKVAITNTDSPVVTFPGGVPSVDGGALQVLGGMSVKNSLVVDGDVVLLSTTESAIVDTGALRVLGGVGITKNLNVDGNLSVLGDLFVRGETTTIQSENAIFDDNVVVLHASPNTDGLNSGIVMRRFQESNNSGFGDVVEDKDYISGTIFGSVTDSFTVHFDNSLSSIDDYYTHWWIKIGDVVRKITGYHGGTRTATLDAQVTVNTGVAFRLYKRTFVGLIYNETNDRFEFGSTTVTSGNESLDIDVPLAFYSGIVESELPSSNGSTGSLVVAGGIAVSNTTDATSSTCGGGLTVSGGAGVAKSLYVGESLHVADTNITPYPWDVYQSGVFSAQKNVTDAMVVSPAASFVLDESCWGFDAYLYAQLTLTNGTVTASYYHLRGVNRGPGSSPKWELAKTYVGEDLGIEFKISDSFDPRLLYTTPDYADFTSLVFKWRVFAVGDYLIRLV
jgi:hypothetical protein